MLIGDAYVNISRLSYVDKDNKKVIWWLRKLLNSSYTTNNTPFTTSAGLNENGDVNNWIFHRFQVIANFYFHSAKFGVEKHWFKQLLKRRRFSTMFNKTALKHV